MKQGRTAEELISVAFRELDEAGVPEARREARDLLCLASGKPAAYLIAHPEYVPDAAAAEKFGSFIRRRSGREPFQQISGRQEFYGLEFAVTPDVMIPRPETELIVEAGLEILASTTNPAICEVGPGSGCIIVSLLHALPEARGIGLEISPEAMRVARINADANGVSDRLDLRESDLFAALGPSETFDLIVSNPPYVPAEDVEGLQPEVRDHEPLVALTDGGSGLSIIERIIRESPDRLVPGGHLLLEIGFNQSSRVIDMFDPELWGPVTAFPDLQGIPRMIKANLSVI